MTQSYKEQVTAEHDDLCITKALVSVYENRYDVGIFTDIESMIPAIEEAYTNLAEGLSECNCHPDSKRERIREELQTKFSNARYRAKATHESNHPNGSTVWLISFVEVSTGKELPNFDGHIVRYRNGVTASINK